MDFRILRYFVAIAEEGSISRAAERLRIAQPALSAQVRNLESELGSPLLHRMPRGVAVTESGAKLLGHARHILRSAALAREDLLGDAAVIIGDVTVSFPQSVAMVLTRPVVEEVLRALPRGEVEHLKVDGRIEVTCEFCNRQYLFDEDALARLLPAG